MDQFLDLEFEFFLFSNLSECQHRQQAEELHMAAVKWAEERSLGIGGGLRVQSINGGVSSRHRFGLCATMADQYVTFQQSQLLFEHLIEIASTMQIELVGGYHLFQQQT